ncbi:Single-stranded DNA-binding protein, partial [human gut metagenome]
MPPTRAIKASTFSITALVASSSAGFTINMNSVQILGNLARDPEVRYTKTGRAVATFTVAA